MYLITPAEIKPLTVLWTNNPVAYITDTPQKKYDLILPYYDWQLVGFPEPYIIVRAEQNNCRDLYEDYKSFCEWTPDLTPGKLPYHYDLVNSNQKHCMKLRANHLINCLSFKDRGHIAAIFKAYKLMNEALIKKNTARVPVTLEEKIEQTLGSFSIIDYDDGPQFSVTDRLMEIPLDTLISYSKKSECINDLRNSIFGYPFEDLTKREIIYLMLECDDFWPLFD